jgi:hypothetical protein
VLTHGREAIFDRHATEADFREDETEELDAGMLHAIEDPELAINVSVA